MITENSIRSYGNLFVFRFPSHFQLSSQNEWPLISSNPEGRTFYDIIIRVSFVNQFAPKKSIRFSKAAISFMIFFLA